MRTVGTTSPAAFEGDTIRVSVTATDSATLAVSGSASGDSAKVKELEARLDKLEKRIK